MRWFQPQLKIIYCYKESVSFFFCGLINSFQPNLFLCNSTILLFSKLSLFFVVSEMKCKCGNNKRLWPRWNFPQINTILSITQNIRELSWMSQRVMRFWFILNLIFISTSLDILASLLISCFFQAALQTDENSPA